jgi:suppressor of ftsI
MARLPKRYAMLGLVAVPAVLSAGMVVGLAIGASAGALGGEPVTNEPLRDPPVLRSRDGSLAVTLTGKGVTTRLAGRRVVTWAYNGRAPGPTLEVRPGDSLQIASRNGLPAQPTNLHVHGMHVSPRGHGDNVFVSTPSGGTFVNRYAIPLNQIPGEYWYHPHRHGYVDQQVSAGMAGTIIVRGGWADQPGLSRLRTRQMTFQQFQVTPEGQVARGTMSSDAPTYTYVNGQLKPVVDIRPGELQRWRLANLQGDSFLRVRVPPGLKAWLIATDANPLARAERVYEMLIPPAGRRTLLVRGGSGGDAPVQNVPWGSGFQAIAQQDLLTVRTRGARMSGQPVPARIGDMPDLRDATVARKRTVRFSMGLPEPNGTPVFHINGRRYEQWGRANLASMRLGTVEEWTLTNFTDEYHPFHIHIQPFQVVSINGTPVKGVQYRDTMPIPPRANGMPGKVVIRQRYTNFTGRFVIHCHILFHEDHGMMAPVRVVA